MCSLKVYFFQCYQVFCLKICFSSFFVFADKGTQLVRRDSEHLLVHITGEQWYELKFFVILISICNNIISSVLGVNKHW